MSSLDRPRSRLDGDLTINGLEGLAVRESEMRSRVERAEIVGVDIFSGWPVHPWSDLASGVTTKDGSRMIQGYPRKVIGSDPETRSGNHNVDATAKDDVAHIPEGAAFEIRG